MSQFQFDHLSSMLSASQTEVMSQKMSDSRICFRIEEKGNFHTFCWLQLPRHSIQVCSEACLSGIQASSIWPRVLASICASSSLWSMLKSTPPSLVMTAGMLSITCIAAYKSCLVPCAAVHKALTLANNIQVQHGMPCQSDAKWPCG